MQLNNIYRYGYDFGFGTTIIVTVKKQFFDKFPILLCSRIQRFLFKNNSLELWYCCNNF